MRMPLAKSSFLGRLENALGVILGRGFGSLGPFWRHQKSLQYYFKRIYCWRMSLAKSPFSENWFDRLETCSGAIPRRCYNSMFQNGVIVFFNVLKMSLAKSSFLAVVRALLEPYWGHFWALVSSSWNTSRTMSQRCWEHLMFVRMSHAKC